MHTDPKKAETSLKQDACAFVTSAARPHCHYPYSLFYQHDNTLK